MGGVQAKIVDHDNVRVGELTGDAGFTLETRIEFWILAQIRVDQLDRHLAVQRQVDRPVDTRHAAPAARLDQAVAVADHLRQFEFFDLGALLAGSARRRGRGGLGDRRAVMRAETNAWLKLLATSWALGHVQFSSRESILDSLSAASASCSGVPVPGPHSSLC